LKKIIVTKPIVALFGLMMAIGCFAESFPVDPGLWAKALARARVENKLIFLDVYATWCAPCKLMEKNVLNDKSVADMLNASFVPAKIDAEKDDGITLSQSYKVNVLPTFLLIDSQEKEIYRIEGYRSKVDFLNEIRKGVSLFNQRNH
jgi:thiol:disulfide interchange protein